MTPMIPYPTWIAVLGMLGLAARALDRQPPVSENPGFYSGAHATVAPAACIALEIPPQQVKRVHDGDTFALYSIGVTNEESVRVLGVNTPELGSGPVADSATAFTRRWLAAGSFTISVCHREKYGRLLSAVTRGSKSLADTLIALQLGVKYP